MNPFEVTSWTLPLTIGLTGLVSFFALGRSRRRWRDEIYLDVDPGEVPEGTARVGPWRPVKVSVRHSPPPDVRPGELAQLIDPSRGSRAFATTILDLAVRGHLRISRNEAEGWALERQRGSDRLAEFERELLAGLFGHGGYVTVSQLGRPPYLVLRSALAQALVARVSDDRHWFRVDPVLIRRAAVGLAQIGMLLSFTIGALLGQVGWGLLGLPGMIGSLLILIRRRHYARRTAAGSAVRFQSDGFANYLRSVTADQLWLDDTTDIFSANLSYAVLYGASEHWISLFNDLVDRGLHEFHTPWLGESGGYPRRFPGAELTDFLSALPGAGRR